MPSKMRLLRVFGCAAACAGTPAATSTPDAGPVPPGYTLAGTGDVRDFDFIAGAWTVSNQRLAQRGVGSGAWEEFPAKICGTLHLGGVVNVDEIEFPSKGWSGVTVRSFDRAKRQWSIYWINSRTGVMYPPVVGGFKGDRGEFYGEDEDDGRPVKVRFVWTKRGPDRADWEQSFSFDGTTWEVNWKNQLTRADPSICAGGPRT
jgi:hypothetical protein